MASEKKEFAWDTVKRLGDYVVVEDKEVHEVKICTLNGKTFLVDTKLVNKAASGWTPVKNISIPANSMEKLMEFYSDWKLSDAFGSAGE